jgi:hypothetical protein
MIVNVRDHVEQLQQFGHFHRVIHAAHVKAVIETVNKELDDAAQIFSVSHQNFCHQVRIPDILTSASK